jgi:hypothetical protein
MSRRPRSPRSPRAGLAAAEAHLRDHALAKPEATELSLSTKLPRSSPVALMLPFAQPTGYGLGKAGWVSAHFASSDPPPLDMLCAWIDESYQAVAPARLAALVVTATPPPAPAPEASRKPKPAIPARKSKPRTAPKPVPPTAPKPRTVHKPAIAAPKPRTVPKPGTAPKPAIAARLAKRQRAAQRRGLGLDRR